MAGPERAGRGSAEVFGVPVGMRKPVTDAGAAFVTGKIFCIINNYIWFYTFVTLLTRWVEWTTKWGKVGKSGASRKRGLGEPGMLFRGQSYRSLDAKGRLVLPPEFREALAASAQGSFVLTTYDGCLVGYPGPLWSELEERFARLRNSSRKIRDFRRLVLGGAEDQSLDAQGRLRLSRAHMEYAGLEHDAVVVGQGDKFEIWDQARFKALLAQDFDDVADELAESGIDFSF